MNGPSLVQADPYGVAPDEIPRVEVEPSLTAQTAHNLLAAVDSGADFAGWMTQVLAIVAAVKGSSYELIAANPNSIESACLQDLVVERVGGDDEHLADYLPTWHQPPMTGVELSEDGGGMLYLTTMIWGEHPRSVYVRTAPLHNAETFHSDATRWIEDGQDPAATGTWQLTPLDPTDDADRMWLAYAVKDHTLRIELASDYADLQPTLRHYLNHPTPAWSRRNR